MYAKTVRAISLIIPFAAMAVSGLCFAAFRPVTAPESVRPDAVVEAGPVLYFASEPPPAVAPPEPAAPAKGAARRPSRVTAGCVKSTASRPLSRVPGKAPADARYGTVAVTDCR